MKQGFRLAVSTLTLHSPSLSYYASLYSSINSLYKSYRLYFTLARLDRPILNYKMRN
jgi:hypothetical protein